MSAPPLRLFSPTHFAILAVVLVATLLATGVVRRWPALWNPVRWLLVVLTSCLGSSWYLYRIFGLHQPWQWALPLELCDFSLWMTVIALIRPHQRMVELAYFWGVAGASLALLMPYLVYPLFSIPTMTFLAGHGMIVVNVVFLLGTTELRPRPRAWIFALWAINLVALLDYFADRALGTNYMYLIHKPPISSLFNVMGPWPWYIVASDGLALVLFLALQWPFRHGRTTSVQA